VRSNLILDGVLDAYLKTHNFSIFYPVIRLVCGDMADDATEWSRMEAVEVLSDLLHTASEAVLHRWAADTLTLTLVMYI
jgi:hypothetical protein